MFALLSLVFLFGVGSFAWADPAPAAPPSSQEGGFGEYLSHHEDVLDPFFSRNQADIAKDAGPVLFNLLGKVIMISLLVSWIIDVLLSRSFSAFFAPAFTKWSRSLIYATGRLILSILLLIMASLGFTHSVHEIGIPLTALLLGVMALPILIIQVGWVRYLFRTSILLSIGFYVVLVILHSLAGIVITMPVVGASATSVVSGFLDQSITPKLRADAEATRQDVVAASKSRDGVKKQVTDLQNQIAEAQTQQKTLEQQIKDKKNSEDYVFGQIVKVHAQGDLTAAHTQIADFLTRFPNGSRITEAKTQSDQIDAEIAAQTAAHKQADADAVAAAAQARADLLAHTTAGTATLSELRGALIGQTSAHVQDLFGPPHETASDRWGYDQKMVVDPLTGKQYGLAVQFSEGTVQGVEFYYGSTP